MNFYVPTLLSFQQVERLTTRYMFLKILSIFFYLLDMIYCRSLEALEFQFFNQQNQQKTRDKYIQSKCCNLVF